MISAVTHGMTKTSEYQIWRGMKDRCLNPNSQSYRRYGGRGITICSQWIDSFTCFFTDMGKRPSEIHSLDRIDNNGNYEPSNCKWSTPIEQANNRGTNIFVKVHTGEYISPNDAMTKYNFTKGTLFSRLSRNVPLERPLQVSNKLYDYNGAKCTVSQLSKMSDISVKTLASRLFAGMDVHKALEMELQLPEVYLFKGEYCTIPEIAEETGLADYNLRHHIRKGLTIDEAIEIVSHNLIKHIYLGKEYTITELAEELNISYSAVSKRLKKGQTPEEIMEDFKEVEYMFKDKMLSVKQIVKQTGYDAEPLRKFLSRGHTVKESMKIMDHNQSLKKKKVV